MSQVLMKPTGKMWWMLILTMLVNCVPCMYWTSFASVSDTLQTMYGVGGAQWALITTMHGIGCGVGLFIVGMISDKLGFKQCCIIGIILMSISHLWFYLWSPTYISALLAKLLGGFGNSWIYNAAYTLALVWFEGTTKQGVAAGATTATDGIGTFAGMFLFGLVATSMGLKPGALVFFAVVMVILVLCIFCLKNKNEEEKAASHTSENVEKIKYTKVFNRNMVAHACAVCGVIGLGGTAAAWGPTMLIDLGMQETTAGLMGSLYTVAGVVSGVIFGLIADHAGKRKPSMLIGGCGMVVGMLLMMIQSIPMIVIGFLVAGFAAYVVYPTGFAMITDTVKDTIIGKVNGIVQGFSYIIGMIFWPMIVGFCYDATGSYAVGLLVDAALTAITCVVVPGICGKDQATLLKEHGLTL